MRRIAALFVVPSAFLLPLTRGGMALDFEDVQGFESNGSAGITLQSSPTDRTAEVAQASFTTGTITVSKNLARQAAERANGGLENYRAEPAMHGPALDAPYQDGGDTWIFTFRGGAPGENFTVESEIAVNKTSLAIDILYNGPLRAASTRTNSSQSSRPRHNQPRNGYANGQGRNTSENAQQQEQATPSVPEAVTPAPRQTESRSQSTPEQAPQEQPARETIASGSLTPSDGSPANNPSPSNRTSNRPAPSRVLSAPGDITTAKNFARQAAERINGGLSNYRAESAMHGPALESPFRDDGDRWIFTFRGGFPGDISLPVESEVSVSKSTFETTVLYNGPLRNGSLQ
ncbi:MAG: hypothetical protein AAF974_01205 [Cyanobacteria bacterium P01_E01_bin.34]